MAGRVYVETSIPSFYCETRTDSEAVARRDWTRRWWDDHRQQYEVFTSVAVLDELRSGRHSKRESAMALLAHVPVLVTEPPVFEIVDEYIRRSLMPSNPLGDALHLALASYHRCDFLLTWNCRHLANANKFEHIRHVNEILGLHVPLLVTPLEMLGEDA
jgi:predicted nucleic acid-binding protein